MLRLSQILMRKREREREMRSCNERELDAISSMESVKEKEEAFHRRRLISPKDQRPREQRTDAIPTIESTEQRERERKRGKQRVINKRSERNEKLMAV